MSVKVYGLDKCDTCKKARKWLDKHQVEHQLIDYREHRVDAPTLKDWAKQVGGWDKLIPESTPQYQLGAPAFRLASMPPAEVRLWSSSAFAGGIQPWWHHIGAMHEDRRQYNTAEPIFRWHEANQDILVNRQPVADVGLVWSQANHDYLGQDRARDVTLNPYRGAGKALDKAGIAWLPIHIDPGHSHYT